MVKRIKIGIQTFFQTNYGAILQAYALKTYLKNTFDADVEIINFTTDKHLEERKILKKEKGRNIVITLLRYVIIIFRYGRIKRQFKRIDAFKDKHLNLTRRYSSMEEMLDNMPEEDIYITGSDQVFNPQSPYSPVYFLAFEKNRRKKIAYAPSFGISSFPKELASQIHDWLIDFDALSSREKTGADYISTIVNKTVPTVVDPVLLLKAEDWKEVAESPCLKYKYIFVYDRNGGQRLINLAKKVREQSNLPVIVLSANRYCRYKVKKQVFDAGPAEFLGYIKDAEYVVTDSFHGTMFSLVFGKQFYVYPAIPALFSRIHNVLEPLGLLNHVINEEQINSFSISNINDSISIPPKFVSQSKVYLNEAINQ